jgi:branched-chain amino acid transport system ATP-binding protein
LSEAILTVNNLFCGYGASTIIKGLNLQVFEGEIVGLVGPNGAGKTTLLETIAGTIKTSQGEICLFGKRIDTLSVMQRRKMGMVLVSQDGYIFPMMPVKSNLEMAGFLNSQTETRELMDYVYNTFPILKTRSNQLSNTLSGGERKMLAVGMGIVSKAKLVLMDEPSIGLAPKMVTTLLETLKQIKVDTGSTLILAEQNVKILKVADRIYGLEAGEFRFNEKTENLDESKLSELYMGH